MKSAQKALNTSFEIFMSGKVMENTLIIGLLSSLLEQSFIIAASILCMIQHY
jgi:hypothetical protein